MEKMVEQWGLIKRETLLKIKKLSLINEDKLEKS